MKRCIFLLLSIFIALSLTYRQSQAQENPIVGPNQKVITTGFLVGGALIGVEAEFMFSKLLGFEIGAGILGAGAGTNLHFYASDKDDYYFNLEAKYMPAIGVVPAIELGGRSFFGQTKKWGLVGEFGLGLITQNKTISGHYYEAGKPMLTYAFGVCFNL